jgi:hypothetical protein
MKRLTSHAPPWALGLALTALAVMALAIPGRAAPPPVQVPFKVTMSGPTDSFLLPVCPPVLSWKDSGAGSVPLLGAFTYVDHTIVHLNGDGLPISCTDGIGAFSAPNGDVISLTFSGLLHPSSTPGMLRSEGAFTVTCGRGRFASATGSGVVIMELDPVKNTVTASWDGTISAPM